MSKVIAIKFFPLSKIYADGKTPVHSAHVCKTFNILQTHVCSHEKQSTSVWKHRVGYYNKRFSSPMFFLVS